MEREVSWGFKYKGNKMQANNGPRTSGMVEDFTGNQALERTVAGMEKKKKTDVVTPTNWFVSYKFYEGIITNCSIEIMTASVV